VLVSKDLPALTLRQFSDEDCVSVLIELSINGRNEKVVFCSLYLPYDSPDPPPSEKLVALTDFCERQGYGLIVGSDTNAHHSAGWGSTDTNGRGEALFEYIMSTNLIVCNQGNKPTFVNSARSEVIDVTFADRKSKRLVHNWQVEDSLTHSDHNKITFLITGHAEVHRPRYRNPKNTNWDLYGTILEGNLKDLGQTYPSSIEEVEAKARGLERAIISAFEGSCRPTKPKRNTPLAWWNADLKALHREANRLNRRYQRSPTDENRELVRAAKLVFKRAVRREKREAWAAFCSTVNSLPSAARLNKILRRGRTGPQGTLKKPDGNFTESPEDTVDLLLQTHFPDIPEETGVTTQQGLPLADVELPKRIITRQRIEDSFNSFAPFKASGPDGILPILIQKGVTIISRTLVNLYRACLQHGYIPANWRRARVVFIPKPGKDDYSNPNSFRPISLTSFLIKGLERLVYWYLVEDPLKGRIFHPFQFAYRPGVSTVNALHTLVTKLEKAVFGKEVAMAAFLDIEGAFNNARIESMVKAVMGRKVPPTITKWISKLLSHREVEAELSGKVRTKAVMKGCPQGGILSPLLWNLVMDSLLQINQEQQGTHCQAYADDVTLAVSGPVVETVADSVQQALQWLERWGEKHFLRFSPSKTIIVLFTRRRNVTRPPLYLYGERLSYSTKAKYLGVTLQSSLSWVPHVNAITRKALNCLGRCRQAVGTSWGLTPKAMLWLYTAAVRPIVEYACLIWSPALDLKTVQKKLNKVQRTALVSIGAAYPSTPTATMEALLGIPPLPAFLKGSATKMAHRLLVYGQWLGEKRHLGSPKSHIDVGNRLLSKSRVLRFPVDKLKEPLRIHERNFSIMIPSKDEYSIPGPTLNEDNPAELLCFTDGSKTENGTGLGVVIKRHEGDKELSMSYCTFATVFQMEVAAISATADTLLSDGTASKDITIYSDSQAAVKALQGNKLLTKSVLDCSNRLNELGRANEVTLKWIPAHQGYIGNESADTLAKQGANDPFVGPLPSLPISLSRVKLEVHDLIAKEHKKCYLGTPGLRQSRMFLPIPRKESGNKLLRLARTQLRDLLQIVSGHANLARHRHICGKTASPLCPSCGREAETASHYLARCTKFDLQRLQCFGCIKLEESEFAVLPLQSVVAFNKATNRLADFGDP
jgi:ribonuclease HI